MTDWPDLIRWNLKRESNSRLDEILPTTEEQNHFLKEAFEAETHKDVRRMKDILKELEILVNEDANRDYLIGLLDELIELASNTDMSNSFCKIGGPYFLIKYALDKSLDEEVRGLALVMLSNVATSSPNARTFFSNIKFYKIIQIIADESASPVLKNRAISALYSILKGNDLANKRIFINKGGYEVLVNLLKDSYHPYNVKLFRLLADLYSYEEYLHKRIEVVEDTSVDVKSLESCTDYAHLQKYFTKNALDHFDDILRLANNILSEDSVKNTPLRSAFAHCFTHFYKNMKKAKVISEPYAIKAREIVETHLNSLEKAAKKNDVYQCELHNMLKLVKAITVK